MSQHAIIIGAGAVGCLSAIALVERGWQVTLIDQGELGAESSWAGGGILFPLLPWKYTEPVNRLALAGARAYAGVCESLHATTGVDPEYQVSGMLVGPGDGIQSGLNWCASHGIAAERRDDHLWLPAVAQARNPRLMRALRERLLGLGVFLVEHTELLPLADRGSAITEWRTVDGRLFHADAFIVTAGAWSSRLLGSQALASQVKPMRGQMLLYRLTPGSLPHILYHDDFYLIPRRDGHVLAGSTVEDVGFDKSTTEAAAESLRRKAIRLLPALETAPLIKHWSGLRPGSPDNVPIIDRHPAFDNLYLNTGHFRYGVTMAPASAKILVAQVCRDANSTDAPDYAFPMKSTHD